jgi:hypothetical protein
MKVQVTSTITAKTVVVWWDGDLFHACPNDAVADAQVCLGVDLFEVVAELAELDLEREDQALEALELANAARTELLDPRGDSDRDDDFDDELSVDGVP